MSKELDETPDAVVLRCSLEGSTVVSLSDEKAGKIVLHFPASEYEHVVRLMREMCRKDLLATFMLARPRLMERKKP